MNHITTQAMQVIRDAAGLRDAAIDDMCNALLRLVDDLFTPADTTAPPACHRCNGTKLNEYNLPCDWCEGSGLHYEGCRRCREHGTITKYGPGGQVIGETSCPDCRGRGYFDHTGQPAELGGSNED